MVVCLERDADLHTVQLMPLPLTVSCFSKIQIGFTFLVPTHQGSPGKRAVKRVCVCWWEAPLPSPLNAALALVEELEDVGALKSGGVVSRSAMPAISGRRRDAALVDEIPHARQVPVSGGHMQRRASIIVR